MQPDSQPVREGLGWELWRLMQQLSSAGKLEAIPALLREYARLELRSASLLHSCVLRIALELKTNPSFNLMGFIGWWDLRNLREEDYQGQAYNGRTYASLAEKAYNAYAKLLIATPDAPALQAFLPQLAVITDRHPEYQWLPYFYGKLLLVGNGNPVEARKALLPFVRKKKADFWAWSLLADTFAQDAKEKQLACLCRALTCAAPDNYLGKVRVKTAALLIEQNYYAQAKAEIEKVEATRREQQQPVSSEITYWVMQAWYGETIAEEDTLAFYNQYASLADALVLEGVGITCVAIIESMNAEKGIAYFRAENNIQGNFRPATFQKNVDVGDCLELVLEEKQGSEGKYYRVLSLRDTDATPGPQLVKAFSGALKLGAKGTFGFVEDVFMPGSLLSEHTICPGQLISGTAIRSFDQSKNRWGWKALKINRLH